MRTLRWMVVLCCVIILVGCSQASTIRPLTAEETRAYTDSLGATVLVTMTEGNRSLLFVQEPDQKSCHIISMGRDGDEPFGVYAHESLRYAPGHHPVTVLEDHSYFDQTDPGHAIICIAINDPDLRARTHWVDIGMADGRVHRVERGRRTAFIALLPGYTAARPYREVRLLDATNTELYVETPRSAQSP